MLDAAHRGWGQGGDSGSHVGRKMQTRKTQRGLRADRSRRNDLLIIQAFGDTVGCIERLPCGVCGRNNLRCLRRGRSRSGCNHFLETCPATESNLSYLAGLFLKSSKLVRVPGALRQRGAGYTGLLWFSRVNLVCTKTAARAFCPAPPDPSWYPFGAGGHRNRESCAPHIANYPSACLPGGRSRAWGQGGSPTPV